MLDFSPLFLNVEKHVQWSLSHVTESKIFQRQLLCELKTGLTCLYMFRILLLQNKSFRQFRVRRNNMLMKNKAMLFFGQCVVDPVSNSREGKYHRTSHFSDVWIFNENIFCLTKIFAWYVDLQMLWSIQRNLKFTFDLVVKYTKVLVKSSIPSISSTSSMWKHQQYCEQKRYI